jgi:hypothetical protein
MAHEFFIQSGMIDADEEPGPDDMAMIAAVKSGDKTDPAHPAYNGPYAIE